MLSYGIGEEVLKRPRLVRNPRFRKIANRLLVIVPFFMACFSTAASFPDPGKPWRPLLIAQIVVAWLAFIVAAWTWLRSNRAQAAQQQTQGQVSY